MRRPTHRLEEATRRALGDRLRRRREELQYCKAALGRRVGVTGTAVQHIEAGLSVPGLGVLVRLADALGVSTDWLLGRTDERRGGVSADHLAARDAA